MTRNQIINWEPFKPFSVGFDNLFDDFDRIDSLLNEFEQFESYSTEIK